MFIFNSIFENDVDISKKGKQRWLWRKPVLAKHIHSVEQYFKKQLPTNLRAFIKENNGASPQLKLFKTSSGKRLIFDSVIDIARKNGDGSFWETITNLKGQLPSNAFPVGFDPFGNIFYADMNTNSAPIFFWKHDERTSSIFLADSIDNFLNNLS